MVEACPVSPVAKVGMDPKETKEMAVAKDYRDWTVDLAFRAAPVPKVNQAFVENPAVPSQASEAHLVSPVWMASLVKGVRLVPRVCLVHLATPQLVCLESLALRVLKES